MLGDSIITEATAKIGIGTPTPSAKLDVAGDVTLSGSKALFDTLAPMLGVNTTIINKGLANAALQVRAATFIGNGDFPTGLDVAPTFAPSSNISLAQGFVASAYAAPPPGVTMTDQLGGASTIVYSNTAGAVTNGTNFSIITPFVFGALKPTTQTGLRIKNQGISGTTTSVGLHVDAQSGSANNYAATFAGGNVGIGTSAPTTKLEVRDGDVRSSGSGGRFTTLNPNNQSALVHFDWFNDGTKDWPRIRFGGSGEGAANGFLIQGPGDVTKLAVLNSGNIGIGTINPQVKLDVNGVIRTTFGSGNASAICRNDNFDITFCSSSIRYKTNVINFTSGLELLLKLRPVSFSWKDNGRPDLGLIAEEVDAVEPLLAFRNQNGEVEGVKYDRVSVVLVNAVKEQQHTIESLQQQNMIAQKELATTRREHAELKSRLDRLEQMLQQLKGQAERQPPQRQ